MLLEIRSGNLTSLMRRKEDPKYWAALQTQEEAEFGQRIKVLYDRAGAILDRFPQVPPEKKGETMGDLLHAVSIPHRLTPAVSFVNGEAKVELRMRELVIWYEGHPKEDRFGVRIEVADDSLSIIDRTLFNIYPDQIITCRDWEYRGLTHQPERVQEIEMVEALVEQIELKLSSPR